MSTKKLNKTQTMELLFEALQEHAEENENLFKKDKASEFLEGVQGIVAELIGPKSASSAKIDENGNGSMEYVEIRGIQQKQWLLLFH